MMKLPLKLVDARVQARSVLHFGLQEQSLEMTVSGLQTPQIYLKALQCSGVEELLDRRPEHYDQTLNHPSDTI